MKSAIEIHEESGALAAMVPAAIGARDLQEFHGLSAKNQARVRGLLAAFDVIENAPSKMEGYALAAQGRRGFTHGSLRRLYREYVNSGRDWRALVDNAVEYTPASGGLPAEFIAEVQRRVDENGRSVEMALKMLRHEWAKGASVPGFGTWREWWRRTRPFLPVPPACPGLPRGWSSSNLRAFIDCSKFRRIAQTRGLQAAHAFNASQVYTTRAGLYVGSHFQFDDLWHDFFVASVAEKKVGRPLELFAHDLFSARKFRFGFRVRTENDNGKAQGLTAKMMRMLVAAVFHCDGYSERGTVCLAEHGTAAFSEAMERVLFDATGGLIRVQRSGMQGAKAHAGQYPGLVRGNPRHKASLESSNNAVHNLTAHLPGQTGPDRQRRPEQLHGLLEYSAAVLDVMQQLPADVAETLRLPILTEVQAGRVLNELYAAFEEMPHNLEGWREAGNVVAEICLAGQWFSSAGLLALPGSERDAALALMESGKLAARERRLSRREVWERGAPALRKISGGAVCELLGDDFARELSVKHHAFEFRDSEIEPGAILRFESLCFTPEGQGVYLPEGGKFLVSVNPFNASRLFVRDAKGRYVGECARIESVSRFDTLALSDAIKRAARDEAAALEPLRARQQGEARRKLAMHKHNAAVVRAHGGEEAARQASALAALSAHFSADAEA